MEEIRNKKELIIKITGFVLALGFIVYLYATAMQFRLNDPDLWWHLKTGDYIMENWEVPDVDPFAYTSPRPLSEGQRVGLRAAWFGQVMLATAEKINGLKGVVYYRNFLIVLPMLVLFLWMARGGLSPWVGLAIIGMPALMLDFQLFYSFERPQGLSFNLVMVTCMVLTRIRQKALERKKFDHFYWVLPVMTAIWSNMHAGFIVGNIIIIIYMVSEGVVLAWRKYKGQMERAIHPIFFIVCTIAIFTSFLNPNKHVVFYQYFSGLFNMFIADVGRYAGGGGSGSWVKDVVLEFKPLYYFYKHLHYDWLIIYWAFTALTIITVGLRMYLKRTLEFADILTVCFVALFANMYARGIMFSLTVMSFYLGRNILLLGQVEQKKLRVVFKGAVAMALALTIGFTAYTYKMSPHVFKPKVLNQYVSPWYPTNMVNFIKKYKIAGPMYNYYTWGGFLIYSMYPQYQVFIDGRALDINANRTADNILKKYPGWQNKLDVYNINFIAIPLIFRESGHIIPLATALVNDPKWHLIFIMNNSAVFVRNHPRNGQLIKKFNLDKRHVYREIVDIENLFIRSQPRNPVFQLAKAQGLMGLGRYKEAKTIYRSFPRQSIGQLKKLKAMGY